MKHIRNYNNYKQNKLIHESYSKKMLFLHDVKLSNNDLELFKNIFEKSLNTFKVSNEVKDEIRSYISSSDLIQEGFFDKLKDRFPKAAEVSNKLTDKAEKTLGSILQKTKDAVSFIKRIKEGIKEFFLSIIEKGKKIFTEQIQSGKLKSKIDELVKTKKDGIVADLKVIKDVLDFYRKGFMSKLLGSSEKNMTDFFSNEQEPVTESTMINEEKGNVIATLLHRIEAIPPFSWLHKVSQMGEAGASQLIKGISNLTQKLGGPAFELPVVALLAGIVIEQIVKGSAGHWLIDIAGHATPFGMAIKGIKSVAFFIALIVALDATLGEKLLGGHGEHEHTDDQEHHDQKDIEKNDQLKGATKQVDQENIKDNSQNSEENEI